MWLCVFSLCMQQAQLQSVFGDCGGASFAHRGQLLAWSALLPYALIAICAEERLKTSPSEELELTLSFIEGTDLIGSVFEVAACGRAWKLWAGGRSGAQALWQSLTLQACKRCLG
jgi:hypothetical protein